MSDVTILQIADPTNYSEMLQITAMPTIAYCRRWNVTFDCIVSIERGTQPWHASYNRIILLKEMIDRGERGWVIYLDTDAVISDLSFDIRAYLADKKDIAAIFVPSGATDNFWDINNGVFMINLDNEIGRLIVNKWHDSLQAISDDEFLTMSWNSGKDDQTLLHIVLRENEETIRPAIHLESPDLLNSLEATFIKQVLRSTSPDFATRLNNLRIAASEALHKNSHAPLPSSTEDDIIVAVYRSILGRNPDPGGMLHYRGLLQEKGVQAGLMTLIGIMLRSPERLALTATAE
jgi:hypothetical protein